jgi:hypothetical protein
VVSKTQGHLEEGTNIFSIMILGPRKSEICFLKGDKKMNRKSKNIRNNQETGGVPLTLKKRTLSKLNGGGFKAFQIRRGAFRGPGTFGDYRNKYRNLIQINQLSNADHGAGCTDTGQLSRRIGCTASEDYC